jgi:hypothetical protein
MDQRITTLEKAFELAHTSYCPNLDFLKKRLKSEGFDPSQIEGKALKMQLLQLMKRPGNNHTPIKFTLRCSLVQPPD